MGSYIVSIILLTVIGSFVASFSDGSTKLSKYVGYTISLCIVCTVISPLFSLINYLGHAGDIFDIDYGKELTDSSASLEMLMLSESDTEIKSSIASMINSRFALSFTKENIELKYNTENMQDIKILKITIDTKDTFMIKDMYEIKEYIENIFMCECEVR